MEEKPFSQELSSWLKAKGSRTFGELEDVFGEKSFAVAFLILMAPSALPIPTGGVTNILEIVSMLLALELIAGRREIWMPKSWRKRNLGKILQTKALPKLVKFIAWFEKRSQKRLTGIMGSRWFRRILGALIFFFTLAAFLSVPFSGLDTLPSLGIVIISLSIILEDALIMLAGLFIGFVGVALSLSLGVTAWHVLPFMN